MTRREISSLTVGLERGHVVAKDSLADTFKTLYDRALQQGAPKSTRIYAKSTIHKGFRRQARNSVWLGEDKFHLTDEKLEYGTGYL